MTKADLVKIVSQNTNASKKQVSNIIDATFDAVMGCVVAGDSINFLGFGTFYSVQKESRTALIPKTKEKIEVPAKKVAKFKPGKILKEKINK